MAEKDFPHMGNAGFPGTGNIDVYAYENRFDYTRWQPDVTVTCTNVDWDSEYRNVPYFENDTNRDNWFAHQAETYKQTLTVETHLLPDGSIKLPIPFDVLSKYNYLWVSFPFFTSFNEPVAYESTSNRRSNWYFFILDVESIAPNTTRAILQVDDWTTFYNSCKVPYMMLERGHWPVARTNADKYLNNPIGNNMLLLADDVSYGDARNVKHNTQIVFNDSNMYAVFICSGKATGTDVNWGTWDNSAVPVLSGNENDNPHVSTGHYYMRQGVPSFDAFAIAADSLNDFLTTVDSQIPQFKQTVQCVFFANEKLVTIGDKGNFCGYDIYEISISQHSHDLLALSKGMFGFDSSYDWFAKLYTYPYSHIEITNGNGSVTEVRIEDTTGNIQAMTALSIAFPAIKLDCVLSGINGNSSAVTFTNINQRSFSFGGDWYKTFQQWDVPTFAVVLSGADDYDVNSYYERVQRDNDRQTAFGNANRSATASQENANRSAAAAQNNANASANTAQENANRSAAAARNNANASADTTQANERRQTSYLDKMNGKNGVQVDYYNTANDITNDFIANQKAIANEKAKSDVNTTVNLNSAMAQVDNESLAATTAVGGVNNMVGSTISGAVGAGIMTGGTGVAAGAAAGAIMGITSAATSAASYPIVAGKNNAVSSLSSTASQALEQHVETYNDSMSSATQSFNNEMNNYKIELLVNSNNLQTNMLDNNADAAQTTAKANATRSYNAATENAIDSKNTATSNAANSYNAAIDNATTSYNTATNNASDTSANATKAIRNGIRQGKLNAPRIFGQMQPGNAAIRPLALYATVVTQPEGAIQAAAQQFFRYGYYLHQQANADDLSLMTHFTYWKAEEIWIVGEGVPEKAQERLVRAFQDGITVWENPSEVGKIDITSNTVKG